MQIVQLKNAWTSLLHNTATMKNKFKIIMWVFTFISYSFKTERASFLISTVGNNLKTFHETIEP